MTLFFLFLFLPPGHIATLFPVRALYPEPRTRPYEIRIYLHRSSLRVLNCRSVQAYKTPNSCGEGLLVNLFGVRPIPTGLFSTTKSTTNPFTNNPYYLRFYVNPLMTLQHH